MRLSLGWASSGRPGLSPQGSRVFSRLPGRRSAAAAAAGKGIHLLACVLVAATMECWLSSTGLVF